jgi:tetraspanin-18
MRRCCAADGSWDYRYSDWWYGENPGVEDFQEGTVHVPETCCVLNFNQDRDLNKVDPQKPEPKDPRRCQEDAEGNKDGSDNLNGRGCFAALLDFMWLHIDLIIGIGVGLGILQIFGLLLAIIYMREMPTKDY